jgi:hypothetical protein
VGPSGIGKREYIQIAAILSNSTIIQPNISLYSGLSELEQCFKTTILNVLKTNRETIFLISDAHHLAFAYLDLINLFLHCQNEQIVFFTQAFRNLIIDTYIQLYKSSSSSVLGSASGKNTGVLVDNDGKLLKKTGNTLNEEPVLQSSARRLGAAASEWESGAGNKNANMGENDGVALFEANRKSAFINAMSRINRHFHIMICVSSFDLYKSWVKMFPHFELGFDVIHFSDVNDELHTDIAHQILQLRVVENSLLADRVLAEQFSSVRTIVENHLNKNFFNYDKSTNRIQLAEEKGNLMN